MKGQQPSPFSDCKRSNDFIRRMSERLQHLTMWIGISVTLIFALCHYLLNESKVIVIVNVVAAFIMLLCILLNRIPRLRGRIYFFVIIYEFYIYIPLLWLFTHGIFGYVPILAVLMLVLIAPMRQSWLKKAMLTVYISMLLGLLLNDFLNLDLPFKDYIIRATVFIGVIPILLAILHIVQEENHEVQKFIYQQSITDDLTGCYNMRYGYKQLEWLQEQYGRHGHVYAMLLLDVDGFKGINDRYGHPAGDKVLAKLCDCIHQTSRSSDMFLRYGGDEFILLLPHTDKTQALNLAHRLKQQINAIDFASLKEDVTISMGITDSTCSTGDAKDMIKIVDKLMYEAKQNGRGKIVSYRAENEVI